MDTHPSLWQLDDALLGHDFPFPLDEPFTVAQALAVGITRRRLGQLLESGYVRRVLRGVYCAAQAPDNTTFRARAVSLVIPPTAVVTDRTAAWLHGVPVLPRTARETPPPIQVFNRDDTRLRRAGVEGGRRGLVDRDLVEIHGVTVTSPLRTATDLGRLLWRFDALAALDGFERIGVDHDELLAEIERFKGYRGVRQLRALAPIADGRSESPGESGLRLHWYDAGLPRPELQFWVYDDRGRPIYRLDLAVPDLGYAGEYDGEEHHSSDADVEHDEERRTWLAEHRHWMIDVFEKVNVYGFRADAPDILSAGITKARRRLARWQP